MKQKYAILLLLLTSLIWGLAFVAQSTAADSIGPFTFNGLRFLIGALVLIPVLLLSRSGSTGRKGLIKASMICGILLSSASMLQQAGINAGTSSGKAGFITSLYILFVPVFSLFGGKHINKRIWACVAAGITGAYMLSMNGESSSGVTGDILVLLSAILFALHILAIEKYGKGLSGIELSCGQYIISGIICTAGMLLFESPDMSSVSAARISILYAGVFSCGIAYTLQVIGQRYVDATPATLALSLESVWALAGGALILHERMNAMEMAGCLILFCSVIAAQLKSGNESS